jgi:hypothetical protein
MLVMSVHIYVREAASLGDRKRSAGSSPGLVEETTDIYEDMSGDPRILQPAAWAQSDVRGHESNRVVRQLRTKRTKSYYWSRQHGLPNPASGRPGQWGKAVYCRVFRPPFHVDTFSCHKMEGSI